MDSYNLAIMFGPSLVRPHDDDMTTMLKDMNDQSQIVESLIRHVSRRLSFCFSVVFFCSCVTLSFKVQKPCAVC